MRKTARLVQVGLGVWGRNWASKMVPKVSLAETVAWVDGITAVRDMAIKELALDPKRCFSSLPEALKSYAADGVIGIVPLSAHADVVRSAIQAQKHVLIEKPFAPGTKIAQELVAESAEQGVICHVSQNYRFFPAPRKALIDSRRVSWSFMESRCRVSKIRAGNRISILRLAESHSGGHVDTPL
ncbi:MAG: Gfo/Idh/MocA family oxidoreductase [Verrucomicrobia bacterium]|nr:Gfo/Idh/MocA family oxidoreductase [Verrucomicrobiota bacterium]